jgi:hypothetical protein
MFTTFGDPAGASEKLAKRVDCLSKNKAPQGALAGFHVFQQATLGRCKKLLF